MTHAIESSSGASYLDFQKSWDDSRPRDRYRYHGRHLKSSNVLYKLCYVAMCGLTGFLLSSMLTG